MFTLGVVFIGMGMTDVKLPRLVASYALLVGTYRRFYAEDFGRASAFGLETANNPWSWKEVRKDLCGALGEVVTALALGHEVSFDPEDPLCWHALVDDGDLPAHDISYKDRCLDAHGTELAPGQWQGMSMPDLILQEDDKGDVEHTLVGSLADMTFRIYGTTVGMNDLWQERYYKRGKQKPFQRAPSHRPRAIPHTELAPFEVAPGFEERAHALIPPLGDLLDEHQERLGFSLNVEGTLQAGVDGLDGPGHFVQRFWGGVGEARRRLRLQVASAHV